MGGMEGEMRKLIVGLLAMSALSVASVALAVPPGRQTVGPTTVVGQPIGNCGDFIILADYTVVVDWTVFFDNEGVPIRATRKAFVVNGTSLVYNSEDPSYWLAGGPGERELVTFDLVNGTETITGPSWKVTVPGYGNVFLNTGRIVFQLDPFAVLFYAGQVDYYAQDVEALCHVLRP